MGSSQPPTVVAAPGSEEPGDAQSGAVTTSARCCGCGKAIADWRERLLPLSGGTLVVTERAELALRVENKTGCAVCGHDRAEIRVEALQGPGVGVVQQG